MSKVIITGAGPAGLTAAYELLKSGNNYEVVILEETDRIGGISQTVRYNGNRMDIGGHRFFSKDDRVTKWWQRLMPMQGAPAYDDLVLKRNKPIAEGGPDPEKTDRVMLIRDRVSRIYYKKHFFDYPVSLSWGTIKNMGFIVTLKAGFSYIRASLKKNPEDNLENFYINRFGKKLYSMFFEAYTEKLWGRHPREIDASWGAQRVKGLSIKAVIKDILMKISGRKKNSAKVETSLIEQFSYPKFGPGQLWEAAASEIEKLGGVIKKNSSVKKINLNNGIVKSVIYSENGEERVCEGDYFISTMPIRDLIGGITGGEVPELVKNSASQLPYRDFVTVGLLLNKINLKNQTKYKTLGNIVPDCWIYVQDAGVKLGRIQIFNNWSPYMVKDPDKNIWIGLEYFCTEGDQFWNMTENECIDYAVGELVSMGIIEKGDILDSHRERIKKAYPAYFDGYRDIDKITEYLNSIGNLYCIGRNGQHRYNNMDHSMATAFEAVYDIVNNVTDKANIWKVNTENSYHEKKD